MIAEITSVWPGVYSPRCVVIAIDQTTGRTQECFVYRDTTKGQLIASLCERAQSNGHPEAKIPIILTLDPPNPRGWCRIVDAELMPQRRAS